MMKKDLIPQNQFGVFAIKDESNGVPVIESRLVAKLFEKEHKAVIRDIRNIVDEINKVDPNFVQLNFKVGFYKDKNNQKRLQYLISYKGLLFYFLNVTGHTKQKEEVVNQLMDNYQKLAISEYERKRQKGYVYLVKSDNYLYRIGYTKNIDRRFKETYPLNSEKSELYLIIRTDNYSKLKKYLCDKFIDKLFHDEWYALNSDDLKEIKNIKDFEEYKNSTEDAKKLLTTTAN